MRRAFGLDYVVFVSLSVFIFHKIGVLAWDRGFDFTISLSLLTLNVRKG